MVCLGEAALARATYIARMTARHDRRRQAFMRGMIRAFTRPQRRKTMTTQEREDTRPAWDEIAPGYDRTNTPTQMWLGNEGLRRTRLRASMRFLDVAAGSGALSIPAARLGAKVLATDQSAVMLEL